MATFTATAAQSVSPAIMAYNGAVTRVATYVTGVASSAGDVIQMIKIPAFCTVTDVTFAYSAASGVVTVNVGDGNDVSAYAASVVLSGSVVALTSMPSRGIGRSYSVEDTIDIQIAAISTPAAAAALILKVTYTNQNGSGQISG